MACTCVEAFVFCVHMCLCVWHATDGCCGSSLNNSWHEAQKFLLTPIKKSGDGIVVFESPDFPLWNVCLSVCPLVPGRGLPLSSSNIPLYYSSHAYSMNHQKRVTSFCNTSVVPQPVAKLAYGYNVFHCGY